MAKYKCKVCGYVHEGNKAPDTCPVCSAPASEFEEIKEEGAACLLYTSCPKKTIENNNHARFLHLGRSCRSCIL